MKARRQAFVFVIILGMKHDEINHIGGKEFGGNIKN